ncbi:MAG: transglycosylase domain-containing protein [Actinobacteria bacterium]|nr:transglycosylase domain-containing protein [Actinomycetota bacterium]
MRQLTRTLRQDTLPLDPLLYLLFPVVIAITGALVALLLLPAALGVGAGADRVGARLNFLGEAYKRIPKFPERSTIYAGDGKTVLAQVYLDENREIVHLDEVSDVARAAVLAAEDDGFYEHGALDVSSVLRAVFANVAAGDVVQGGSTITQQLVKNAVLDDAEQTIERKWQELAVAVRIEQRYTKDEIFELYLNDIYLGNGVYGIGTAAQYYFHEPASKLTLGEGAMLAGMIRAPEDYDPIAHPKKATARRNFVLDRMVELGDSGVAKAAKIVAKPVTLPPGTGRASTERPPFFVTYITEQILANTDGTYDAFGDTAKQRERTLFQGGLKIITTLDPQWERAAQAAANQPWAVRPGNPGYRQTPDTAIVSVDNVDGAIRTMLSGRNYQKDRLELATATRQTGSAFKAFTLTAAFEEGIPPGQVYSATSPFCSPAWTSENHCVSNAEPGRGGYENLTTATAYSTNVVFAQLALDVGPSKIAGTAHAMGITSDLSVVPSITLGTSDVSPLEMASAYQTLANEGRHCEPFAVARVEDAEGLLYRHKAQCRQVIDPDIAAQVTSMLQGVVTLPGATGTAAAIGRPVAGKTGTTQEYSNAWFVGYTPQVSTAVWVGFPGNPDPLDRYFGTSVFGGSIAAPIWHTYMTQVMSGMPVQAFPAPPPPETGKVPDVTGRPVAGAQQLLAESSFSSRIEHVDSLRPEGTVVDQVPGGGATAQLGTLVTLRVSSGRPPTVVVPAVQGKAESAARTILEDMGFVVHVEETPVGDPKLDGVVLGTAPKAGTKVDRGSVVTMDVGVKKQNRPRP